MPVPQLPIELVKLIVADPPLEKDDLQSLSLTTRLFPPLVRPHLFRRLEVPFGSIPDNSEPEVKVAHPYAITLDQMDRLLSFRRRSDLAGLVKEVWIDRSTRLDPPPQSLRMAVHDLTQLVYTIFPNLEKAGSLWADPPIAPPRSPLPCCQVLHTLYNIKIDVHTWTSLQMCGALRRLNIAEVSLRKGTPAMPPSLPFRLETLEVGGTYEDNTDNAFLRPFLRACGSTLTQLWLGENFNAVPNLSILPRLVSLVVQMSDRDAASMEGGSLGAWFATALPTCTALERLTITTTYAGYSLLGSPQGLLAVPEVAAALPSTLKRIDFDMAPFDGELEAALRENTSVQVVGIPTPTEVRWLFGSR